MAAKAAAGVPAPSYTQPFLTGECTICRNDTTPSGEPRPLYRWHKSMLGTISYEESKHGKLTVNAKGYLGFDVTVESSETAMVDGIEKTVTVSKTYFQRVGTAPDEKAYLFTEPHTACEDCMREMIKAAKAAGVLKCPECRTVIPKGSILFPPAPAAVTTKPEGATATASAGSTATDARDYLAAAMRARGSSVTDEDGYEPVLSRRERRRIREAELLAGGPAARAPESDEEDEGTDTVPERLVSAYVNAMETGRSGSHHHHNRIDFSGMDAATRATIKALMQEEKMNNKRFLEAQNTALYSGGRGHGGGVAAPRSSSRATAAGGAGHEEGVNEVAVRITVRTPRAAAARPSGEPSLKNHEFIAFLVAEGNVTPALLAVLDDELLENLIISEAAVRKLISLEIPLTSILREGNWIFAACLEFRPQDELSEQLAFSGSADPNSPLGKLYKACVTFASAYDPDKAEENTVAVSAIRDLIDTLSVTDRNLLYTYIRIANKEPVTSDLLRAEHNMFNNPIALYDAVKRTIEHKLLSLSNDEWEAKKEATRTTRHSVCLLADILSA